MTLTLLLSLAALAQAEPPLVSDYKYAWPREREIRLDGTWELACTEPSPEVGTWSQPGP